ncbi:MAG: signal peptide peptidase SppA [Janthinobacterium lividum]
MKQFFLTMLGVFAGLVTFFVILPVVGLIILMAAAGAAKPTTPSHTVLELDLRNGLTDQTPTNPFAMFGDSTSVMQVVDTLAQAEQDSSVKVLLVRAPEMGMTPAYADEIRQAIQRFRKSGKTVIAHSQGFLPAGAVVSSYMVASSADELWMQNTSSFQATGLSSESLFLGRALQKYGVTADFEQRYEYKNAVNEFTQSDYTAPHREAMLAWMNSIHENALSSIAADRDMTAQSLKAIIEGGPYTSERAVELKLVDRIGQVEEAEAAAREKAGKDAKIVKFGEYASMKGLRSATGSNARSTIAIVSGEGAIMTGRGGSNSPFGSATEIRSDDLARSLYKAVDDKDVKAIVFRVSSPGGSPDASEQILAALRAAKAAGKPVVVSMGAYAASGGYWISSEADWIVAQPTTLTGSIGVYGGKIAFADALSRFGVDTRRLSVGGQFADAYNTMEGFSPEERAAVAASMDLIYEQFVARVAKGRNLPVDRVREIARGRVWTGAQALELGLVDQMGGVTEAVAKARQLAEIPSAEHVRLKYFPAPQTPWEALASAFGTSSQAAQALVGMGRIMNDPAAQSLINRVQTQRLREQGHSVLAEQPAF